MEKERTKTNATSPRTGNESGAPRTAFELMRKNVQAIRELEGDAKENRSRSDRVAEAIANFCGSMTFVYVHIALFVMWIVVNVAPGVPHIDPFPFEFLNMAVSLEAIFLSTFILISQNHDMRLTERRNHLDLQINLLTEQENTAVLSLLERIAAKIGVDTGSDPNITILQQKTDPKDLAGQIDQTIAKEKPQ
ncbi:MAG TPA: DUF1003 domain-containing protein [Bacteroidota bacterium]|nr:DUF1003 domain-containing protein [Bacteroidota bacterium]